MITLPHHVELLSDAWIEEAGRFLAQGCERQREALAGRPFSVSETFTDPPPHYERAGHRTSWTVRYDGEKVAVSHDFDPGANVVIEGDFQAALMLAQVVGARAAGVLDAARHEMTHWFGPDVVRSKGRLESSAAQTLMAQLHDHMARRTVENPDLGHRAERLGLVDHIREVETRGYSVIERAISPEFADALREATLRALLPHHDTQLQWMLYHGPEFERIVQNPMLMTLMDASLGRGAVIASLSSIRKGPGPGGIPCHTDYSLVPEPHPEFALTGVGVWALEDWTVESGPTWIAPGTHRLRRGPRPGETPPEGVPIEMPKGSVVYLTHGIWHWQGDRSEPGDRVTLHAHFNRGILRGLEPKKIDVQMLHRHPPRLGEMLGEDDWFDKLSAQGRDYTRAAYMARLHDFTEKRKRLLLDGPTQDD